MYNLRYHIASLVAVFIALATGLLLGTVVAEQGMLDSQGVALVEGLQTRFDEISSENARLELGLERDRDFASDAVGPLTAGRLVGQRVAILTPAGETDTMIAAREAAESAGAEVVIVTLATPAIGLNAAEPEGLAGFLHGQGVEIAAAGAPLLEQVSRLLSVEWQAEGGQPLTEFLVTSGLISLESALGTGTVDSVVITGSGNDPADPLGVELAKQYVAAGGRSVGVDLSAVEDGAALTCAAAGIPAVDHLALPQGRYSLVAILTGAADGHYGEAEGADAFYPPIIP